MALVFAPIDNQDVKGRYKSVLCTATIASYTSGGEAVSSTHAASVGLRQIVGLDFEDSVSDQGSVWVFDRSVPEIRTYATGSALSGALVENAAAENAGVVRVNVYGY